MASALDGAIVGRASSDECYEGQQNYKVNDGYAHRCTIRRTLAVSFDGDFRERIARFDTRLFSAGWGCHRVPCDETLSGKVEEYWDLRAGEVGGGTFPISRLPSSVNYERDDLYLYVDYAGADPTGRSWIEGAHRRRRGGLFESYERTRPLAVTAVLSRAAPYDHVVVLAIESDYFEVA